MHASSGAIKLNVIYFDTDSTPRYLTSDLIEPTGPSRLKNADNTLPSLTWQDFNNFGGSI